MTPETWTPRCPGCGSREGVEACAEVLDCSGGAFTTTHKCKCGTRFKDTPPQKLTERKEQDHG